MNFERWQKIKEIFNQAAEMPAAERHSFVRAACDETEMLREVEKMLGFADEDDDVFEQNAFEIFTGGKYSKIPEKIGNYKIVCEIGRGGMGVVYEALRENRDFKQRVALKILKRGMDTEAILSRFRHEQRILASLEHPNIARFLDDGMTEDGLPFYVMEYVEGKYIDDYCRDKSLDLNERLKIFRKICAAVQYAHQNLVIHRDLKPSNILINEDGEPKLLDFGIGKVLTPDSTEEIGTATQFGMMTPKYASPEQIFGRHIGAASDLYSLGVILYELLTGHAPYKINFKNQLEIERAILETEPVRPSSAAGAKLKTGENENGKIKNVEASGGSPVANHRSLRGDLDNIILKSLEKKPENRYLSVGQFSEDIRRYLEGLPVFARPQTFNYRAAKFVRRNSLTVTAGALIFLSLCAGITVAVWQAHEARLAKLRAEKRFAEVRQMANNVVFKYHDAIADLQGSTAVREMLVRDALIYLDKLAQESIGDAELEKELALAYLKLGDVQGKIYAANIGDTEGALNSYRKAVALLEDVVKNAPDDIAAKENLIKGYDSLAFLLTRTGGGTEVRENIERALNLYYELEKSAPGNSARRLQFVELLIRYGDSAVGFENNLREHLKALPVAEQIVAEDPNNPEKVRTLIRVNQRIGTDYQRLGTKAAEENRIERSKEFFRQSLAFQRRVYDETQKLYALEPEKPANYRYVALASINLGESLSGNGEIEEALQKLGNAQKIIEDILRLDPKNNETKFDLAITFETFGAIYQSVKNYEKAYESYNRAIELEKEIFRTDPKNLEAHRNIVQNNQILSEIAKLSGSPDRAELYRQRFAKAKSAR